MVQMRATVYGLVQGVSFRATTRFHAVQLGLSGTVKNLSDGSVEIYAEGPQEVLEALLERLQSDARGALVKSIKTEFGFFVELSGFKIIH